MCSRNLKVEFYADNILVTNWVDVWVGGNLDLQMDGQVHGWIGGWLGGWMGRWVAGFMDGWVGRQIDRWVGRQMGRQIDRYRLSDEQIDIQRQLGRKARRQQARHIDISAVRTDRRTNDQTPVHVFAMQPPALSLATEKIKQNDLVKFNR